MNELPIQDCGHVQQMAGICQYHGCGKELCPLCIDHCDRCGTILCRAHQVRVDAGRRLYCQEHAQSFRITNLGRGVARGLVSACSIRNTRPDDPSLIEKLRR